MISAFGVDHGDIEKSLASGARSAGRTVGRAFKRQTYHNKHNEPLATRAGRQGRKTANFLGRPKIRFAAYATGGAVGGTAAGYEINRRQKRKLQVTT